MVVAPSAAQEPLREQTEKDRVWQRNCSDARPCQVLPICGYKQPRLPCHEDSTRQQSTCPGQKVVGLYQAARSNKVLLSPSWKISNSNPNGKLQVLQNNSNLNQAACTLQVCQAIKCASTHLSHILCHTFRLKRFAMSGRQLRHRARLFLLLIELKVRPAKSVHLTAGASTDRFILQLLGQGKNKRKKSSRAPGFLPA